MKLVICILALPLVSIDRLGDTATTKHPAAKWTLNTVALEPTNRMTLNGKN